MEMFNYLGLNTVVSKEFTANNLTPSYFGTGGSGFGDDRCER
jgi:hypothetical protein